MNKNFALGLSSILIAAALGSTGCGDDDSSSNGTGGAGGTGTQTGGKSAGGEGGDGDVATTLGTELHVVAGSKAANPDGTKARPFPTLYAAIDAIAAVADWDGTIVLDEGKHELDTEVVIPPNAYLTIAAGSTIASGPGVSIHAQRDINASGTEAKPIVFTWLIDGSHWGSLTNFTPTSQDNVFKYVTFEHGYETDFNGIGMRGALSLNKAKALISHCTFQNNEGDDGLNIKATNTKIEYSLFKDNASDGLDSDGVGSPEVAFCTFDGNGNDNLDLGEGTKIWVHDSLILHGGDKGISNGDGCTPTIEHNIIANGAIGVGIKDDAAPLVVNNTIYGNQFGLRVYHHVDGFGGGKGTFINNIVWKSTEADLLYSEGSTVISYSCFGNLLDADGADLVDGDGNKIIDQPGVLTQGAGCDDPLFADPDNLDFHLQSEIGRLDPATKKWVTDDATSPCIDGGDPDTAVGDEPAPNGSRVDMGTYGGTAEASKSP
jgi:hypothetical protein